jgi:biopolymer transport protein ExbD
MAYIPSHKKRHRYAQREIKLQLTSMMDMFTIILVFLLKIYSTQGQLVNPSQDLTLPVSRTEHPPEHGLDVTVSREYILVNGRQIESMRNITDDNVFIIPRLREELLLYAREAEKMQELYNIPFSGKVTIQGDKRIPYTVLMKIMATCGQSRFPNMRLIVYQEQA